MSAAASSVLRKRLATAGATAVTTVAVSQALESKSHASAEQADRIIFHGSSSNTSKSNANNKNNSSMVRSWQNDGATKYALDVLETSLQGVDADSVMAFGADLAADPAVQAAVLARVKSNMEKFSIGDGECNASSTELSNVLIDPAQVQEQFKVLSACLSHQRAANHDLSTRVKELEAVEAANKELKERLEELEDADELNNQLVLFAQMKADEKITLKERVTDLEREKAQLEAQMRKAVREPLVDEGEVVGAGEGAADFQGGGAREGGAQPAKEEGGGVSSFMKAALGVAGVIIVCVLFRRLPNTPKMTSFLGAAMAGMFASKASRQ